MAYRYEQTANGGTDIVIDGWERGIADSPYSISVPSSMGPVTNTGMVELSYGNITGIPGEFSVNYPLANQSISGHSIATPYHKANETGGAGLIPAYYILDSSGRVFINTGSGWTFQSQVGTNIDITGDSFGNEGMVWWKGYLFVIRIDQIYYSSNQGVSFTNWTATVGFIGSGGASHSAIVSVNDAIYFCNGSDLASIVQTAGQTFDPTSAVTYTFQSSTVSIPSWDSMTCLAEINNQLMIGGGSNRVYVWDEISSNVGYPLFLSENFVRKIVVSNTNAYIFTGSISNPNGRGFIYISNGSNIDIFKKMPDHLANLSGTAVQEPYWTFGDAIYHRNKLFFGALCNGVGGVWAIDLNSMALYRSDLMSSGAGALATVLNSSFPSALSTSGLSYFAAALGIINQSTSTLSTAAVATSDQIPVGTFLIKNTSRNVEVKLAVPLAAGESVVITANTDTASGITVGTMTSADGVGAVFPASFEKAQWVQITATLNPTNSSPSYCRLREIRIR